MAAGGVPVWQLEKADNVSSVQAVERLQASHHVYFRICIAFAWNLPALSYCLQDMYLILVLVMHRLLCSCLSIVGMPCRSWRDNVGQTKTTRARVALQHNLFMANLVLQVSVSSANLTCLSIHIQPNFLCTHTQARQELIQAETQMQSQAYAVLYSRSVCLDLPADIYRSIWSLYGVSAPS